MLKIKPTYTFLSENIFLIIICTLVKWFFLCKRMERNLITVVQSLILKKIIQRIKKCNNSIYLNFSGLRVSLTSLLPFGKLCLSKWSARCYNTIRANHISQIWFTLTYPSCKMRGANVPDDLLAGFNVRILACQPFSHLQQFG